MADERADIDAAPFGERIEVIGDRFPSDIDARPQHPERDLLGVGKEFEIPRAVAGPRRGEDLAALADDHRRMPVLHRGAAIGVPDRLWVEMGMVVDEAGGDDPALGVDPALGGGPGIAADADDLAVGYRHIGDKRRLAGTVDDAPVFDEQIIRHDFLLVAPLGTGPRPLITVRGLPDECYALPQGRAKKLRE